MTISKKNAQTLALSRLSGKNKAELQLTELANGNTLVVAVSKFSGKLNQMELPVGIEKIRLWQQSGQLIQNALSELNADQREFLLSGCTPEEWNAAFPPEE